MFVITITINNQDDGSVKAGKLYLVDLAGSEKIGKTGITDNIVEEVRGQLKKRKLVKIKINKGIYDRDSRSEVWEYLSQKTSSVIVLARGNVGVLWSNS